jgi:hypothetical protein
MHADRLLWYCLGQPMPQRRLDSMRFPMSVSCPEISDVAIIADDARLAAQLSCLFAEPRKYLPILEQPRLTRADRDNEVIRCTNALARSKAKHFIFAALGDITTAALSVAVPAQKTIHVRTAADIPTIPLPVRNPDVDPLEWGKDRIGIGLLKALRARRAIVFNDNPSPAESIPPKSGHLVVCEEGDDIAQVIAANYAFATGAGLHLIPETESERAEQILEEFYGINDNPHRSVSDTLTRLRQEVRELTGPVSIPPGGSITFITDELPLGFAFPEVPCTHLFIYPNLGISIVQGLAAEQRDSPGTRVATLVNPQTAPAPEIDAAVTLLRPRGIYVRKYEGPVANVTSVNEMIELFPYDLLLIATHCGDVSGYRWTYEYEDSEGYQRTLVVDIALGIGRTNVKDLLDVKQFMRFISLDGVDWNNPVDKKKLYVGKAILTFIERVRSKPELKPVKKGNVARVSGSAALAMADGNLIALPRSLAHEGTPIIINNACVSWHRLAKTFMFGGARVYMGTLMPVTSAEAAAVVERMLGKHFAKPLPTALWAAQRDVYGADGRTPYVMLGVFSQRLRPSRINAPQYIMGQLAKGRMAWRRMLARMQPETADRRRALESYVQYCERELERYQDRWLPKRPEN